MKKIAQGEFEFLPHYCNCPCHGIIILNKNKFPNYERSGYPKFINYHSVRVNHPMKGKHHTEEAKELNRQKHIGNKNAEGHIVTKENKLKLSELHKGNQYRSGCVNSEEHRKIISENNSGRDPWNKGLTGVQESPMKGKHHSPETIELIKQNTPVKEGEDHWNYQGGITPLYKQIRFCEEYDIWRTQVFERDLYICQDCQDMSKRILEAHHIKGFSNILKENNIISLEQAKSCNELWNISNGITLCQDCHNKLR